MLCLIIILGLAASSVNSRNCTTCDTSSAVNPDTCLVSKNGTGQSWMQMSESCLSDGGRLLLMQDNVTYIEKFYMSPLVDNLTNSTDRLVIALMVSQRNDQNVLLYDKSVVKNNASCSKVSSANCMNDSSPHLNQTNCENIGCCWKNEKCFYPGMGILLSFHTFLIIPRINVAGRSCMYMQKENGTFVTPKWVGEDCFAPAAGKSMFICEYACSGEFPIRETVTIPFVGGSITTLHSGGSYSYMTTTPITSITAPTTTMTTATTPTTTTTAPTTTTDTPTITPTTPTTTTTTSRTTPIMPTTTPPTQTTTLTPLTTLITPAITPITTPTTPTTTTSFGLGRAQLMNAWFALCCVLLVTDLRHV